MSEWISVKERLPERGVHVLVYDGRISEDYLGTEDHEFMMRSPSDKPRRPASWVVGCVTVNGRITHWMPLPDAPTQQ